MESFSLDTENKLKFKEHEKSWLINVGSRKSELALIQTKRVTDELVEYYTNNKASQYDHEPVFNVIALTTTGDQITEKPLHTIGTKSLFTRELELALLDGRVHFVVHSLKDLPTSLPQGCTIGAILKRDDPNDVIILKKSLQAKCSSADLLSNETATSLGSGYKIGTSSQRRIAMIKRCNQQIECVDIRGNLNTRLKKLDDVESEYSAIILARAGLDRMGWSDRTSGILSPQTDKNFRDWHYAVGQGAIAVECRVSDTSTLDVLQGLIDLKTTYEVIAERSLMKKLEAGCSVPLGVRTTWSEETNTDILYLEAIVLSLDGKKVVKAHDSVKLKRVTGSLKQDKYFEFPTNITLPVRNLDDCLMKRNVLLSSELGLGVANKMISQGCLDLMRCE